MAGRQHKLIDDCVRRYNLPAAGETVDLFEVITFLHNLLAKKGHRLADDDEIAALEKQKVQQQVEKLRNESLRMQLTLERERGNTIDRAQNAICFAWLSNQLRTCGENIGRAPTGREAQQMLNDLLARMRRN